VAFLPQPTFAVMDDAAFLSFILHHVQERCRNGQAHELTGVGNDVDDNSVNRGAAPPAQ
jgi:hypothetical protein